MAKTRRKPWFRMWDELLTDPKMLSLTNAQVGIWTKLLCFANQQTVRGIISFEPGTFERTFEKVCNSRRQISTNALKKFKELGMIEIDLEEGYVTITNWNKRQFASDDVTARTRKFKESKRSRKRSPEQNRKEGVSKHLRSGSESSFAKDHDEQSATLLGAKLPDSSPLVQEIIELAMDMYRGNDIDATKERKFFLLYEQATETQQQEVDKVVTLAGVRLPKENPYKKN